MENTLLEQLKTIVKAESGNGLALINNLAENPVCSIILDQDVGCIFITWKQYVTSAQLRFILEHIIRLLEQYQITKVLGDDTALPTIHSDDQKWIVEDWMPRAKAAGLRMAANKIPATYFGKVSVESVQSSVTGSILLRAFDNITEARNWLKTER